MITNSYPGREAKVLYRAAVRAAPRVVGSTAGLFFLANVSASDFGERRTHTDALYFAVTVFSTVGFGDISAKSETARLVVTGQMLADLVVLGLGIRVILGAVGRGRQRQQGDGGGAPPAG